MFMPWYEFAMFIAMNFDVPANDCEIREIHLAEFDTEE